MFATLNIPAPPIPAHSYAGLGQAVSSEISLGNLPSRVVHSAVALPGLNNQRGGQAAISSPLAPTAPQITGQSVRFNLAALSSPGGSPDFSVAFFTQLLSQSSVEAQVGITSSFSGPVPLRPGDPEMLTAYSYVKYLPSDASKPEPRPLRVEPLPLRQESAAPEPQIRAQQQQAAVQAQVQQAATTPQTERSFATIVMRNSFSYAPVGSSGSRSSASSANDNLRADRPILPKEGAAAYDRTASRIAVKAVEPVAESNT